MNETMLPHASLDAGPSQTHIGDAPEMVVGTVNHPTSTVGASLQTMHDVALPKVSTWARVQLALRVLVFALSSVAIWGTYFTWRPPAPMLFLRHTEHLGRDTKAVSINFDDAPHPLTTPLLLAALKRADAKASFFVIGDSLKLYPELARRIVQEGHALANHSQNHHNLSRQSPHIFRDEIEPCFAGIRRAYADAGVKQTSQLFRPPGGGMNRELMDYLYRNNIELAWWSNNMGDWARPPAWKIADQVKANLRPGDIILLHDTPGGYGTPQAIPAIVRAARRQGLECVTMPEPE